MSTLNFNNIENQSYPQHTNSLNGKNSTIKDLLEFRSYGEEDLPLLNGKHNGLYSKMLHNFIGYEDINITFQKTEKGGKIDSHKHDGSDATDEIICLLKGEQYGDIGSFQNNNGIMRIPTGQEHGGNSYGTWISIKPRGYTFITQNKYGLVYEKGGKQILISRGKVLEEHKQLLYINNLLLISIGKNGNASIGKIGYDNLREQNGDFILIGEVDKEMI